jgi:hypothetical protein
MSASACQACFLSLGICAAVVSLILRHMFNVCHGSDVNQEFVTIVANNFASADPGGKVREAFGVSLLHFVTA